MDVAMLVGRILFGLVFIGGAAGHFLETDMLVKIVDSKGLRPARPLVLASGVVQLAGAVLVMLGLWADLGAIVLFAFLVPTAILIHNFWAESDPQQKMLEQVHFNKDISLAGAALFLAAFVAAHGDQLRFVLNGSLYQHIVH
jgi:putative oxidoreductase